MGRAASTEEKIRRLGRESYKEIVVPRKRAPVPMRFEKQRNPNTQTFDGIEFAREPLSNREFAKSIGSRAKQGVVQHIVVSKKQDDGVKGATPWQWIVVARCKAKLRRAAVKVGRQFLELDVCPKCWKNVRA